MKLLIDQKDIGKYKSREKIPLECECCRKTFYGPKHKIQWVLNHNGYRFKYCSEKCRNKTMSKRIDSMCEQCQKPILVNPHQLNRFNHHFCSRSCAAIYHNSHKHFGCRRSKLEMWIEKILTEKYPHLEIHYNKTNAINAELDIYIPSLKLAFELNGVFHYEPIFSEEKLKKTQTNDQRKFQVCSELSISLCVIDVHNTKYLKKERDKKFLDIVVDIINEKLARKVGTAPTSSALQADANLSQLFPE